MPTMKLQSSDGVNFDVDLKAAEGSMLIKTMLNNLGKEESGGEIIPVPTVNSRILEKVIEWLTYHKDDDIPPGVPTDNDKGKCDPKTWELSWWDAKFLSLDYKIICDIFMAANYLDVTRLMEDCGKKLASMMRGKTAEEMREMFDIVNDFTPEEMANVEWENSICDEI